MYQLWTTILGLRTLNYERAIVHKTEAIKNIISLRTLNYERTIVQTTQQLRACGRLRTLNYERAIVQPTAMSAKWRKSQNPQLREGYCAAPQTMRFKR